MSAVASHVIEQQHGRYLLSTDPARVDIAAVHRFLSESSYWARGRPFDMQATAVANSLLVVGAYLDAGADGAHRSGSRAMVTDLATFAWLSDVYVLDEHQGSGLGTAMVRLIVEHPPLTESGCNFSGPPTPMACTRGSATPRSAILSGGWCGGHVTFPADLTATLIAVAALLGATAAGRYRRRRDLEAPVGERDRAQLGAEPDLCPGSRQAAVDDRRGRGDRSPPPAGRGQRVKAIGAGHSFTAAAMTNGVLLSLDAMNAVEHVDVATGRVTVQAGIRLRDLCDELAAVGLAMPNLGDINAQSIAGAISTATHGTGAGLGNLATTIVGMELVTGTGEVITCDAVAPDPDLLRVARVGVGALGIVTKVTIQCVPAFDLHAVETIEVLDDVLDDFANFTTSAEHVEFYWMPGTRRCQVKRNHRTTEPARPQSRFAYVRDKYVAENAAFGMVCRVGRRFPALAPRLAKLITSAASERDLIDRSDHIFCSPRRVRFVEMEYGIPVEAIPEAVGRVRDLTGTLSFPPLFPIEVRVSAADDIPLSTGAGRANGWIAVHQYHGAPYESYFQGVEAIMDDYEGRPHWGKLHYQSATTLRDPVPAVGSVQRSSGPSSIRVGRSATSTSIACSGPPVA